jgi:hypothetical protein
MLRWAVKLALAPTCQVATVKKDCCSATPSHDGDIRVRLQRYGCPFQPALKGDICPRPSNGDFGSLVFPNRVSSSELSTQPRIRPILSRYCLFHPMTLL